MRTELVSIPTDTHPLDGAYYEPENREITGTVMLLHGNCMNFYVCAPRFLPPVLCGLGLACLAFNRRGHDVLSTRDSRDLVGGAYQTSAEAIADNRYAADWLAARGSGMRGQEVGGQEVRGQGAGSAAPIVIGHSNGGTLAVRHVADVPETPALVLLSAHLGGTRISGLISSRGMWAGDQYDAIGAEARRLVAAGRGRELMLLPGWWNVTSAESALDYLDNLPDTLELAPQISCPVLFLRGDQEPAEIYPAEAFAGKCAGPCDVEIIEDCGHFYDGREDLVSGIVAGWLARTGVVQ